MSKGVKKVFITSDEMAKEYIKRSIEGEKKLENMDDNNLSFMHLHDKYNKIMKAGKQVVDSLSWNALKMHAKKLMYSNKYEYIFKCIFDIYVALLNMPIEYVANIFDNVDDEYKDIVAIVINDISDLGYLIYDYNEKSKDIISSIIDGIHECLEA